METTEEQAFLRTIFEFPHDDVPRLVFADWLEENGHPARAEFIRLQCQLAGPDGDPYQRTLLEKREKLLWQRHRSTWAADFSTRIPFHLRYSMFHRGFPAPRNLELNPSQFLALADECFAVAPLWELKLSLREDDELGPFAKSPRLSFLGSLDVRADGTPPRVVEELLSSTGLTNLRELKLRGHPIRVEHLETLARSKTITHLRKLVVDCNPIGCEGAEIIGSARNFAELETLELNMCSIGDAGLAAILRSPHLQRLKQLYLPQNNLAVGAARSLMRHLHFKQLTELGLYCNHFGDDGTRALALNPALERLKRLDLGLNRIGSDGARALVESPYLFKLRRIDLMANPFSKDARAIQAIRSRFGERAMV